MRVIEFWTVGIRSCAKMYASEHKPMTETLSIRIDAETKKRLDALSKSSKRSKSCLAAEAIAAYVLSEEWQLGERQAGIAELESGREVSRERASKWLNSWGKPGEIKAPR
jgi:RHH-type rel operon transcriptional repressor/antitoxin RelB